jgi:hypothetical protein
MWHKVVTIVWMLSENMRKIMADTATVISPRVESAKYLTWYKCFSSRSTAHFTVRTETLHFVLCLELTIFASAFTNTTEDILICHVSTRNICINVIHTSLLVPSRIPPPTLNQAFVFFPQFLKVAVLFMHLRSTSESEGWGKQQTWMWVTEA